jgi:hypothetical protein
VPLSVDIQNPPRVACDRITWIGERVDLDPPPDTIDTRHEAELDESVAVCAHGRLADRTGCR